MKKLNISNWELEELVLYATGKKEEEVEKMINDHFCLEDYVHELITTKYHNSYCEFLQALIGNLMEMIFIGTSPLSGKTSKGFGIHDKNRVTSICKILVTEKGK